MALAHILQDCYPARAEPGTFSPEEASWQTTFLAGREGGPYLSPGGCLDPVLQLCELGQTDSARSFVTACSYTWKWVFRERGLQGVGDGKFQTCPLCVL